MLKTRAGVTIGTSGPDADYVTTLEACAIIGGTKPISLPTLYRDPELKGLIEHPSRGVARISRPKLLATLAARREKATA
jgi:hypothetical protein